MESDANPMQRAHAAARCTAHSKRSGLPCRNPAVRGWRVCRMHGAGGGAPCGSKHPNYRHGLRTTGCAKSRYPTAFLTPLGEILPSDVNASVGAGDSLSELLLEIGQTRRTTLSE